MYTNKDVIDNLNEIALENLKEFKPSIQVINEFKQFSIPIKFYILQMALSQIQDSGVSGQDLEKAAIPQRIIAQSCANLQNQEEANKFHEKHREIAMKFLIKLQKSWQH